jgi:hypothetical protein
MVRILEMKRGGIIERTERMRNSLSKRKVMEIIVIFDYIQMLSACLSWGVSAYIFDLEVQSFHVKGRDFG